MCSITVVNQIPFGTCPGTLVTEKGLEIPPIPGETLTQSVSHPKRRSLSGVPTPTTRRWGSPRWESAPRCPPAPGGKHRLRLGGTAILQVIWSLDCLGVRSDA